MTVVVADTTPIHYLVLIDAVDVLPRLFDQVILPETVHGELLHPATPPRVRHWVSRRPAWAVVRTARRILPLNLDPGETEAIALARELGAFAVLLDDGAARHKARAAGLRVTGTIGILERAAAENLVDLPSAFERLQRTTYYAPLDILRAALERDAARRTAS